MGMGGHCPAGEKNHLKKRIKRFFDLIFGFSLKKSYLCIDFLLL